MTFKLKPQYETEVYLNHGGGITIKQENFYNDDAMVILSIDQFKAILKNGKAILNGDFDDEDGEEECPTES